MAPLSSFINSKSGRKAKSVIKSPFAYLRGEPSTLPIPPIPVLPPPQSFDSTEVIDINDQGTRYSLDFDGGKPIDEYEKDLVDQQRLPRADSTVSPQVQLDIDLSPDGLTDWFPSSFLRNSTYNAAPAKEQAYVGGSGLRNEVSKQSSSSGSFRELNGKNGAGSLNEDDESYSTSSEDVLANLQAMNPSHFGKLPGYDTFNRLDQSSPKKSTPNPITIPAGSPQTQNNPTIISGDSSTTFSNIGPLSASIDTPASSSISGTTLARALMSNSFVLPHDHRMSRYRSSVNGLTRSDSTTLPRAEHSFGAAYNNDRFSIGPDAPPIPSNAEFLYEPPKKARGSAAIKEKSSQNLKRRSSTGSLNTRNLPDTPSTNSNRPNSVLFSPGVEFDMHAILLRTPEDQKPPSLPRSPLPPTPRLPYSAGPDRTSFTQESLSDKSYQEAIQRFPLDSQLMSPDLTQLSPATSSEGPLSAKNYEDVLNYYSLPDSPAPNISGNTYRPAFSPISEESTSQLSPPTPYRSDKRESIRSQPIGARSPLTGSLRIRGESVPLPRVPSESRMRQQLLPIRERPRSVTQLPSPASAHSSSSFASAGSDLLAPPPISNISNRARSGSAPSPIIVVRDSRDANAYKITITPRLSELGTPTEDAQMVTQEFPETPDAFSPLLTTDANGSSSMMQSLDGHEVMPMASGPLSATLPGRGSLQPTLAQQRLLNRAATTVGNSRQTSISKIRTNRVTGRSGSPSSRRIADIPESPNESPSAVLDQSAPDVDASANSITRKSSIDALVDSPEAVPVELGPIILPTVPDIMRSPSRTASFTQGSDSSSMYTPSIRSESSRRMKSLPSIPVSPLVPSSATSASNASMRSGSPLPVAEPSPPVATTSAPVIPPPPTIPPPSPTPSQKLRPPPIRSRLPPALTITNSNLTMSQRAVAINGGETNSETSPAPFSEEAETSVATIPAPARSLPRPESPVPGSQEITVPNPNSLLYGPKDNSDCASDIFRGTSLGSPPPYYTVVSDTFEQTEIMNSPPGPTFQRIQTFNFGGQSTGVPTTGILSPGSHNAIPGPSTSISEWASITAIDNSNTPLARGDSVISQRSRRRPPLPAGPRRPSQIQLMGGQGSQSYQRDRAGSVSSVASTSLRMQASRNHSEASPAFSPKFHTPAPKWRGYTMEAAKWTFTSSQLQAIVSRAIRQSAEASSIRLLRLEILDNEVPEEIRRLEAQRTDLKTRYKVLAKKRAALFDALTLYMGGADEDNTPYVLRLVDELKEVSINLDKHTEELHSLDGQLAYLDSLTQIHTGSALAMALRKLNASFLKQVADNQALRNQIQALEAERDEAWQQAEFVADEYDRLNDKFDDMSSKRSSRVSAVRKSSVRVSKAGLRTPSQRLSQISSHGSGMHIGLTPSSSKSPLLRLERSIPPVPPIPRRRTLDGLGSPLKSSAALSSTGLTPSSETRALVQAQDELYAMLGLVNPERTIRRSLSFSMLQGNSPSTASAQPPTLRPNPPANSTNSWRRSSLPGDDALAETYNAMAADRNAILATIDMLSSTD
ncbi:hypothetical protein CVT25_010365 [Psilocybe cyanescens]|uniref:Uncharacterized protein n=1 Tax=Psilocybe cyanescens TaxID=93625 RepID=A0A409XP31_PSICY|nr:hypothetical protein CVT25_010365 [Psilocybe cyanescens]